MCFEELKILIANESKNDDTFDTSSQKVELVIAHANKKDFLNLVSEIGVIPETIGHDSSEEKLFAKAADSVLARAFSELGIRSTVNRERANCADVAGDARAFRLSRTAKNQKDFKVKWMVDWKQDKDYSVLVCPYFQYPKSNSQIYGQAIDGNVCLFSWEQLQFLLENNIRETKKLSLAPIWNLAELLQGAVLVSMKNLRSNFADKGEEIFCECARLKIEAWKASLVVSKRIIVHRGEQEIEYWKDEIEQIKAYSRQKAIKELLIALKLKEKIMAIEKYINSLKDVAIK